MFWEVSDWTASDWTALYWRSISIIACIIRRLSHLTFHPPAYKPSFLSCSVPSGVFGVRAMPTTTRVAGCLLHGNEKTFTRARGFPSLHPTTYIPLSTANLDRHRKNITKNQNIYYKITTILIFLLFDRLHVVEGAPVTFGA